MSLRARIAAAATLPSVGLLLVFCVLVFLQVRAQRLADLDAALAGRAAAVASTVEHDEGWETDPIPRFVVAPLAGWRVEAEGRVLLDHGAMVGRAWSGTFDVESAGMPQHVVVTVWQDTAPLTAELGSLLGQLIAVGLTLSALAFGAAHLMSGRIVASDAFQELHAAWTRQRRFSADASHELRTPLATIRSEAEVALRRERTPEQYREALQGVVEGAARMQGLIDGLLLLARADDDVELGPADLADAARAALAQLTDDRVLAVLPDRAPVRGDARLLQAMVHNLVANAVRYTAGAVRVTLERTDRWSIAVEDDGPGIAAEHLQRLFEPFYRSDEARSRAEGGAGLGLSIVQRIVRQHGAQITVVSDPPGGSRFVVSFPPLG